MDATWQHNKTLCYSLYFVNASFEREAQVRNHFQAMGVSCYRADLDVVGYTANNAGHFVQPVCNAGLF